MARRPLLKDGPTKANKRKRLQKGDESQDPRLRKRTQTISASGAAIQAPVESPGRTSDRLRSEDYETSSIRESHLKEYRPGRNKRQKEVQGSLADPDVSLQVVTENDTMLDQDDQTARGAEAEQEPSNVHSVAVSSPFTMTPSKFSSTFDSADRRLLKLRKAVEKFMKKTSVSITEFIATIEHADNAISDTPFFRYAKKFFASTSPSEFKQLTLSVIDAMLQERGLPSRTSNSHARDSGSPTPTHGSPADPVRIMRTPIKQTKGPRNPDVAESNTEFLQGPLTETEEKELTRAIQTYRAESDLTHEEFCNVIWDLPKPLGRLEKKALYSQFIYLFPDRRPRSVRDHIRRAYTPYDRSTFTAGDDKEIARLYKQLGADWGEIAISMGRYKEDVRDRYRNHIATTGTRTGEWSRNENNRFVEILSTYKNKDEMNWGSIAKQMGTRSRPQCRDRYARMQGKRSKGVAPSLGFEEDDAIIPSSPIETTRKRKPRSKILAGDVFKLLKLIRKSKAMSIGEAATNGSFDRYLAIFTADDIATKLEGVLKRPKTVSFEDKLREAIKLYSSYEARDLKTTLVK